MVKDYLGEEKVIMDFLKFLLHLSFYDRST